jgi:hypothetical protein
MGSIVCPFSHESIRHFIHWSIYRTSLRRELERIRAKLPSRVEVAPSEEHE